MTDRDPTSELHDRLMALESELCQRGHTLAAWIRLHDRLKEENDRLRRAAGESGPMPAEPDASLGRSGIPTSGQPPAASPEWTAEGCEEMAAAIETRNSDVLLYVTAADALRAFAALLRRMGR